MFKIIDTTIHLTRGDVAALDIKAKQEDGTYYTFKVNDIVRFKIMKKGECNTIYLTKDVTVGEEAESVVIPLTSENTKIGDLINKPTKYWYEVELNPDSLPQTIIGFDEEGEKLLILYPEGSDE